MEVLNLEDMCGEFRKNCHNDEIVTILFVVSRLSGASIYE